MLLCLPWKSNKVVGQAKVPRPPSVHRMPSPLPSLIANHARHGALAHAAASTAFAAQIGKALQKSGWYVSMVLPANDLGTSARIVALGDMQPFGMKQSAKKCTLLTHIFNDI